MSLTLSIQQVWDLIDQTKMKEKFRIDQNLQSLKHLSLDQLKKVFVQYRFFTKYYIDDLALLVSKVPLGTLKSVLAEILNEELGEGKASEAHTALYDNFLLSIGVSQQMLLEANFESLNNLERIQQTLREEGWAYGVGLRGMGGECLCQIYLSTMHEYFTQNLSILNIQNQIEWKFWDIHIREVDLHHQEIMRSAISEAITIYPEITADLINGYLESKKAWDSFWENIFIAATNHSLDKTHEFVN